MTDNPILSLCLIARDSARTLGACLASIRPWVDEIVVVDTGSNDETVAIARQYGADVFEFGWCDDFSAARNESLKHARGKWLFWMDSDDTIDDVNGRRLHELAYSTHPAEILGYVMKVRCPGPCADGEVDCTVVDHVKLIRNLPTLRFDGRIHEQVLPAIRQLGGDVGWTDIHVVHTGSDQSPAGRNCKHERDLRILLKELDERPSHPFTLFNLGMTYNDMANHPRAIDCLKRSIAVAKVTESHLRKAYALLVDSLSQLNRLDEASELCRAGRNLFADDPELLFRQANIAHRLRRLEEAERSYIQLLGLRSTRHFSSIDPGILGYKARHNLAAIYLDMKRGDLAELQWRHVVRDMPLYRLGWRGLIESQIGLGRYQSAQLLIDQILESHALRCMALLARANLAMKLGRPSVTKRDLLAAIQEFPDEIEPLEAYCRFLFEHGDPFEAKLALRELANRVPGDAAVLHNLGAINARLADYAAATAAYEESLRLRPGCKLTQRELASVAHVRAEQSGTNAHYSES